MRLSNLVAGVAAILLGALLCVAAWAQNAPMPGTVNYVEGQVSIDNQPLNQNSVGSTVLAAGQSISTGAGKAEVLLTPGVFIRIGDHSSAILISPSLTNTEVRLTGGEALVEATDMHGENNLQIDEDGASARLLKKGIYEFSADLGQIRVFRGEAMVQEDDREVKVKGDHELALNGEAKPQHFDTQTAQDSLYQWSSLRSSYLADANADAARYYYSGGFAWPGAGWYWDPYFGAYTYFPSSGILYSPFGWSYYAPWWGLGTPFVYRGHPYRHFDFDHDHDFDHGFEHRGSVHQPFVPPSRGFEHGFRGEAGNRPLMVPNHEFGNGSMSWNRTVPGRAFGFAGRGHRR